MNIESNLFDANVSVMVSSLVIAIHEKLISEGAILDISKLSEIISDDLRKVITDAYFLGAEIFPIERDAA